MGREWLYRPHPLRGAFDEAAVAMATFGKVLQRLDLQLRGVDPQKNRQLLAAIYGCPEDLVDDVVRIRLEDP